MKKNIFNKFIFSVATFLLTLTFTFSINAFNANAQEEDENEFDYGKYTAAFVGAHSGYVQSDGSLFMWGDNRKGALGIKTWEEGGTDDVYSPKFITKNVKFVAGGRDMTAIIKKDGSLWTTGEGPLGDGTTTYRSSFKEIMDDVIFVATGDDHALAVKKDGSLWAWGNNTYGQFCNGTRTGSNVPVKVMNSGVKRVHAGLNITAIVKEDGSVWTCGYNYWGQLGTGHYSQDDCEPTPQHIVFKDDFENVIPIKQVSVGYESSLFLLEDNTLWFVGWSKFGDACLGDDSYSSRVPVKIQNNVKYAYKAWDETAFIKNDNTLYMCGYNGSAELGIGRHCDGYCCEKTPQKVMENVQSIFHSSGHALSLKLDGSLYSWGGNGRGSCGIGNSIGPVDNPTRVKLPVPIPEGKTLTFNGEKQVGVDPGIGYSISKNTGKKVGNYKAIAKIAKDYEWADGTKDTKRIKWSIVKAPNTLTVVGKQAKVKFKKVKKGDVFIARKKLYTIKQNKGTLTFKKASGNKNILVEKDAGTMKVSKGLKQGTYTVKVNVTAKGNESYKAGTKTATVTIVVE